MFQANQVPEVLVLPGVGSFDARDLTFDQTATHDKCRTWSVDSAVS